jgi:hypothetical protein
LPRLCLAGFDFPIGPAAYEKQSHLISALGVRDVGDLRRICEHATSEPRAACPLFWTLGGNLVGKAAIAGWREIVVPAPREEQIAIWPFHGELREPLQKFTLVITETYPREAYRHVGVRFGSLAREPIGTYEAQFAERTWPTGLLESVLLHYARKHRIQHVRAFFAATPYRKLVERVRGTEADCTEAVPVSPVALRGGALITSPRAQGEALAAALTGDLNNEWTSSDGLELDRVRLA